MTPEGTGSTRVETLTVLFTDLVGSTDQRVRVGEEVADQLRARHDRLASAAIVTNGGKVVKHTGDGVMATFTGASEALAGAVAVQQAIAADNGRRLERDVSDETLQVRIGISAGDVTVEHDDCFGLPVVEAQRLEGAAQPRQILASSLVGALSRGRRGIELRSIGALELKGLDGSLDAQEVLWSPLPHTRDRPLPPALVDQGSFPFAGRVKEAELLDGAWSAASTGGTRLLLIAGEPGIGKTRLVVELARRVAGGGGTILAGRCDELVGVPYQPFVEALRWHVTQPGGTDVLGPTAGELKRLLPELGAMIPDLPVPLEATADAERLRLFESVRGWLTELAGEQPVLLALDDLHWADMGTLLLVRHLVATDAVPRLLVTATYRDTDLDRTHPLASMLADFRRRSDVTRVALDGLDAGEVTDLLMGAAAHDLEEDGLGLALALQEETGGNPFFVSEVLRHLAESGVIVRRDGRWTASDAASTVLLPEGIRDVVGRRLSVLPDATQQALRTAAVIGTRFTLELLAAVSDEDEDALLDALEPALTAHLLTENGVAAYQFAHALVRSTLHGELSTTRRARLHKSVAVAIEGLNEDRDVVASDLAYHWSEAGAATQHEEAIVYARRAAELAFARSAPEEAVRWYRLVRELLDGSDAALDAELLYRVGQAEAMTSSPGWQDTLLDAARAAEVLRNVVLMTEALCINQRSVFTEASPSGANPDKIALIERALDLADDDHTRARLSAVLAVEMIFTGDVVRREALIDHVYELTATIEDPIERYRVQVLLGGAMSRTKYSLESMQEVEEGSSEVFELARERGEHDVEWFALRGLFYSALIRGHSGWRERVTQAEQVLEVYPHPYVHDFVLTLQMTAALVAGEPLVAAEVAENLERQWIRHNRAEGMIYAGSGRLQAARETIGTGPFLDLIRGLQPDPSGRPDANSALTALSLFDAGDLDGARQILDERGTNGFRDMPDDASLPVSSAIFGDVAARLGHEPACIALYEFFTAQVDIHQATGGWYLGSTKHYRAMLASALGRYDEADRWFAGAERDHEVVDTPTWIARTRVEWAESMLARGNVERARELAQSALEAIGEHPLLISRSRATALLA